MRLGDPGAERPVVRSDEGTVYDLRPITADIDGPYLADGGIARARVALDAGRLPELDPAGLRVGAPIARPHKVVCIGLNYRDHAAETGAKIPTEPIVFFKGTDTVIGPYDEVLVPRKSEKTDWEVELAVVIGAKTRYLDSPAEAASVIAGYAISNDVSEREFQTERGGNGSRASPAKPSTRSAPGWCRPTRSTRKTWVCACPSTVCNVRAATPTT